MNKRLLLLYYRKVHEQLAKCRNRLERRLSKGTFKALPAHKRNTLLQRISRLQFQLNRLQQELSLILAGSTLIATLGTIPVASAQVSALPVGTTLSINTTVAGNQTNPEVATDGDGDFVVVWQDNRQANAGYDIYMRRYNAAGVPVSGEIRVNDTYSTGAQINPTVAMDADGDFVVAWEGEGTGDSEGIFAKRFDGSGTAQGGIFRVNAYTINKQINPVVAMDADGDFVIAWQSSGQDTSGYGILARRYNAAGSPNAEFQVNTIPTGNQINPSVAINPGGNFVIAWQSSDGSNDGIFMRRYNATGTPLINETAVNTTINGNQYAPDVSVNNTNFIIAWVSTGQDGASDGIYARLYKADGTSQNAPGTSNPEFRINTYTTGTQAEPLVSSDDAGNFVIVWQGEGVGDAEGVFARQYDFNSLPLNANALLVNTTTAQKQSKAAVAMDAQGNFIIAWSSYITNEDVLAKRYTLSVADQRVHTTGTSHKVAMDADGDYVMVWQESDITTLNDIYAQRFNKAGIAQGTKFLVTASKNNNQVNPSVAMDPTGNFVVVWEEEYNVYARKFTAAGVAQNISGSSAGTLINAANTTANYPVVSMDSDGDFVIVWQEYDNDNFTTFLMARRYATTGMPKSTAIQVDEAFVTPRIAETAVAMNKEDEFVVVWRDEKSGGIGIYGKKYNKNGTIIGPFEVDASSDSFEICQCTTGIKHNPSVAIDAAGGFVVVWDSDYENTNNISGRDIFMERFSAAGIKLDPRENNLARKVNTWTGSNRFNEFAHISMDNAGNYTIVWTTRLSEGQTHDGSCAGISRRHYTNGGIALTEQLDVNNYVKGNQRLGEIAMSANGDFVVVWQSAGDCGDGNLNAQQGLYNRLFQWPTDLLLSATTVVENLPVGTIVGTLASTDATAGDAHVYSLVTGGGSLDNGNFTISGNELKSNSIFNFETRKVEGYSIRVRSTDAGGMYVEKTFKVMITDINEAPGNITLNTNTVFENRHVGTLIGSFSTTDIDVASTAHTYTLVPGTGNTDNASFVITGNQLVSNIVFDYEAKSNFSIRVRSTDSGGLFFEKVFTIVIANVNDRPTLSDISPLQIQESDPEQNIPLANISAGGETNQILTVTATADQLELISGLTITYVSPNNSGSLRFSPVVGKSGTVNITVKVTDNGGTANGAINFIEKSFRVDILGLPKAPLNLTAKASDQFPQRQIDLVWRDVEQETGYRIQVSVGDDTNFQNIEPEGVTDTNDTTFSHTPLQAGTKYFYRVVAFNGVGSSPFSEVVGVITASDIVTNIEDEAEKYEISIYPNPTSGNLRVDISALFVSGNESCILNIYNAQGRSVWIKEWKGTNQHTMNISQWQAGLYQFVFTAGRKQVVKKIIKY